MVPYAVARRGPEPASLRAAITHGIGIVGGWHLALAQAPCELLVLFSEEFANDLAPCRVLRLLKKLGKVLHIFPMNEEPHHHLQHLAGVLQHLAGGHG